MNGNVEKINLLLESDAFVEKLQSDLSDEGIVKAFESEGVKLEVADAQELKKVITKCQEIKDEELTAAGGKSSNIGEATGRAVGELVGDVAVGVGQVAKGVCTAVGGVGKGVWKIGSGAVMLPGKFVYNVGKGICKGVKKGFKCK